MNVYDSTRMADALAPSGYRSVPAPESADMVILNTCHIREKASEKVFSELGRLRRLKEARAQQGERMILAVAGCVAQAEGAEILARAPFVDIVLGPQTYHRLPDLVDRATRGERVIDTEFPPEDKFDRLPEITAAAGVTAFLAIQEGCDKFCSFCVVPYTRGAEQSRPASAVLAEARRLVAAGAREITLLGQNVNAWHGEGSDGRAWNLGRLIRALADIPGLLRLRYTTSHPRDMDQELITAHRDVPTLMPFLHLPVQSGSDRVLAAMNRRHRADDYRRSWTGFARPGPTWRCLPISSSATRGRRQRTSPTRCAWLKRSVSPRPSASNTHPVPARRPPGAEQVPEAEKTARLAELQALLRAQQARFNAACVGLDLPVLFTGPGRHPGQIAGRSPYLQPVHVHADASLIGAESLVRIGAALPNSLSGHLSQEPAAA